MRCLRLNDTIALLCLFIGGVASTALGEEISLRPLQDTTIFQENGNLQNGAGTQLFSGATAGRNAGAPRRTLISFDAVGNLPEGATITSVALSLTVNRVPGGAIENEFGLHRLTQPWIPGTGDANGQEGRGIASGEGATWTTSGATDWETPGGDFIDVASSSTLIGGPGTYVWSSDTLVSDLQSWIDAPESNFGWILIGDEETMRTAKRFASSSNATEDARPTLTIGFEALTDGLLGDFDEDGLLLADDIDLLCDAVLGGQHPAVFDLTDDGLVDLDDHRVWVEDVRGTFFGDADLNGEVSFSDFLIHSSSFGQLPALGGSWTSGDFNCDNAINFADFLLLSQNFGRSSEAAAATAASAVPEPNALMLFLLGLFVLPVARRRR